MGVEEDIIPTMALGSGSKKQGKKAIRNLFTLNLLECLMKYHLPTQRSISHLELLYFQHQLKTIIPGLQCNGNGALRESFLALAIGKR